MVKREIIASISEDNGETDVLNEHGKRVAESENKEGKKRIRTRNLYRQPTVQELNRLQETENLFNSNLFRLQIDEVLQEVKLKEKTEKKFTEWLTQFKNHLQSISEDTTEYDLSEQTLIKKLKVRLPVTNKLSKTKCMFKFHKFQDVEIVGSYSLGCVINSNLIVDIQIMVPAETYTKNDSINYRYHKKRAAYLAYIASHLTKTDLFEDLKYSWLNGCETKPILELKPSGKLGNHVTVRISLTCEQEAYKLHRFSPSRNNLRESWLFEDVVENTNDIGPPTPYYNSSVLSDLTASANQELLTNLLSKSDNLKQAVVLLKIWLRQRKLKVSGYIVSLLVAYFVQIKRINNIMSSYQIVRNIWIAVKSLELDKKGISLHKGQDSPDLEEFHRHFPVVFIDVTGYYNICWSMCRGTYQALKRESTLAVEMLDNAQINSFIPLFMTPVKPLTQFDHMLRFKDLNALKDAVLSKTSKHSQLNYGLDTLAFVTETIHALLTKGLGNRADLVLEIVEADFSWPVNKKPEKVKGETCNEKLSFGVVFNSENALNTVEKGPPANLPEAEEFRAFWGDKSELRRFQDGSITETCVWGGDSAAERRTITMQILDYLLQLKYGIPASSVFHVGLQLERVLCARVRDVTVRVEEECSDAIAAFDCLRTQLRGLTELPLDINAVYGVSSVFSYSSAVPRRRAGGPRAAWRRAHTCLLKDRGASPSIPPYTPVSRVVLELGHSGKWPGDIEAFRCLKAAFHLQIADRLHKQYSLAAQAYPSHVDVIKNGLVFRLSIAHQKEITLLRKVMENGVAKYRDTEESVQLYRDTVVMPRLRGALHGLHQKYSSFGPTVALFKRWASSHLLSPPHIPRPLVELLVSRVYLQCPPLAPPHCPTVGLLRVWDMLANTDWDNEVIVLDFNDDLTREQISSLEQCCSESRPSMCIFTTYDAVPARAPSRPLRNMLVALSRAALQHAHTQLDNCTDDILGTFVPTLSGYDVLIHLDPKLVPHAWPNTPPENDPTDDVIPVVDFHPVQRYLNELRSAYSDFALFFHDRYGGKVVAVLWKPDIHEYREFQLLNANALIPEQVDGETKYKVNIQAIIKDFKIIGNGLVKTVTVQ